MKSGTFFICVLGSIFLVQSCAYSPQPIEREFNFNTDWKFIRSDVKNGQLLEIDDADWRSVDLPHDYSIENLPGQDGTSKIGPFTKKSAGGPSTGHVLGGTAWYRKHFTLEPEDENKVIKVVFDGIYMNADVWINGQHLGNHPYGYTAFCYDLTNYLKTSGQVNVLAVQVKNEGQNSRWYTGSGIYRNVTLLKTDPVHIDVWGNYVTYEEVQKESAQVVVNSKLTNALEKDMNVQVQVEVLSANGTSAGKIKQVTKLMANSQGAVNTIVPIANPSLWSVEAPTLYTLEIGLYSHGKLLDKTSQKIGIRSIEYSTDKGFLLNGQDVLLKGACMHHDNGILGSAAFDRAEYRRVRIMKEQGYNAIRTAHNPPSTAFLNACDELGMLVIDESFDQWQVAKKAQDYNLYFDAWWERDMESMLLCDRNHPSIIMWSFGNEIKERADSAGLAIARKLIDKIHTVDPTRPATQAICKFFETPGRPWEESAPAFALLDVHGYNYQWQVYIEDFQKFPTRIMYASESVPMESFENWQKVKKLPYVIGDFVWTGMDYFGESGLGRSVYDDRDTLGWMGTGDWPWFNAYCGDIDVLGNAKPQKIYKDVLWGNSKLELVVHEPIPDRMKEHTSYWGWPNYVQSWTWDGHEGEVFEVQVYSSYEQVKLELNGKEIGVKDVSEATRLKAGFMVSYAAGKLVAIGMKDGKEVARTSLKTADSPHHLHITAERTTIDADPGDLAYFNVEVLDAQGVLVPEAELPAEFEVQGVGRLQAVGNGNPTDMKSFKQAMVNTFKGRCQLIVRPIGVPGGIKVKVASEGLIEGNIEIEVR
jgi:beta-galactosidase